ESINYEMEHHIAFSKAEELKEIPGHDIKLRIDGDYILVGTRKLMEYNLVTVAKAEEQLIDYEQNGKTAMLIAINGQYRGIVAVADTIKDTAVQAIRQLKEQDLDVIMLTGDNERTAQAIAHQVGIDHVIAEVLPEQKADTV